MLALGSISIIYQFINLSIYQLLYISQINLSCTYFLKVALKE